MHRLRPPTPRLALVGLAVVLIGACGSSPPTATPPSSTPTSVPTASPTATPSPTPPGPWVDAVAALADPNALLAATLSGRVDVGDAAPIEGTYRQHGSDLELVLDTTITGTDVHIEQRDIGSEAYRLAGPLWRHVSSDAQTPPAATLAEVMAEVTGATADGRETVDGQVAERYELAGIDVATLAAALGLVEPGSSLSDTDLALLVTPDGQPLAMDLAFSDPGPPPSAWDLRMSFTPPPESVTIERPDEAWTVKGPENGYTIWYPDAFELESDPASASQPFSDWFIGEKETARVSCVPRGAYDLASWVKEGQAFYAEQWGARHDATEAFELPAGKAVLSTWERARIDGERTHVNLVSVVIASLACDILWFRGLGADDASDTRFGRMVGTFQVE